MRPGRPCAFGRLSSFQDRLLRVALGQWEVRSRSEKPAGDVTAQDEVGAAGGADATARNVVSAACSRAACRTVQGIGERSGQVPLGAGGSKPVQFLRSEPAHQCRYICHAESLLADAARNTSVGSPN